MSKFDLKNNFVNNKKSNACRFLNSYALKLYEGRSLKTSFKRLNIVQFGPQSLFNSYPFHYYNWCHRKTACKYPYVVEGHQYQGMFRRNTHLGHIRYYDFPI